MLRLAVLLYRLYGRYRHYKCLAASRKYVPGLRLPVKEPITFGEMTNEQL